jgi:hypothetical protein
MRSHSSRPVGRRGQATVEFALTIGLFMLVVGALIQFAVILWSQNTINQVARDTARWAVTQSTSPCDSATTRAAVAKTANDLAGEWSLMSHSAWGNATAVDATPPSGIGVNWYPIDPPAGMDIFDTDCPPSDNRIPWAVEVRVNHTVPIFIPGLQLVLPGCNGGVCISSTTELRMEPKRPE